MMRGFMEPDASGALWLACPACGSRLAVMDPKRPGVLLWSRHWRREGDGLRWHRARRWKVGVGPDPVGTYSHPGATAAECPGEIVRGQPTGGCGEDIEIP